MIAIIDGGSTKCDWVILDNSGKPHLKTTTLGFNPNIINVDFIGQEIDRNEDLFFLKNHIEKVFFYGSGCGTAANAKKVETEFIKSFPQAEIRIKEDMTAAAYAAYNGKPAIVCILGTGSNSCFFDGEKIRIDLPSLGFLIGDEGSGSALGKNLLRRFFMKKLPADLERAFIHKYNLTIEDAIKNMYHNPRANAYLGEFNKFIAENKSHSYFQNMVFDEMKNFLDYQVLPYPEAGEIEINFIGYIAYIYEDILRSAAAELNLTIGKVVQKPIESLVDYHKKYILNLD
ncbi:BadF/BadG/BcrA/BcrD ATPase family protein [Kaistella antarctica]|uniref:ATPase n=1 Tax=Kaistella antarctica TaxID=266748 RepID=A0A448NS07_9FLAO|nr:BadF/BadG/BcrA/BcrD ATPase family protein [Kaistella antarctica]KEY18676.1 ATPase [Kaistella antarctica]SEW16766.1 BadF/BadG/BcrA/BcrD ATPase family protein [Kaistella antarctica]VEH99736.1 BadF/BadG/BcrA/BcrD ATPase family [Kaistella antarctica]